MFSIKFKFPSLNTILRGSVAHCVQDLSFDSVSKFLHPLSSRLLLKNIILELKLLNECTLGEFWRFFAKVVMDLVSLTHYCSHVLVTTSTKVKGNHQDFDHDHDDHHHLDRLDAWSSSINYQSQLSGIKSFLWQLLQPHTMYFPLKLLLFSIACIIIIIIIISVTSIIIITNIIVSSTVLSLPS